MKRDYDNNIVASNVKYFCGTEIENTTNKGLYTLFVVGSFKLDYVLQLLKENKCEHLFIGANHSYKEVLEHCVLSDILTLSDIVPVTVDCTLEEFNLTSNEIKSNSRITKVIRMPIENVKEVNNLFVKVDDLTFDYSNEGVWVSDIKKLMIEDNFTDWKEYKKDVVIK